MLPALEEEGMRVVIDSLSFISNLPQRKVGATCSWRSILQRTVASYRWERTRSSKQNSSMLCWFFGAVIRCRKSNNVQWIFGCRFRVSGFFYGGLKISIIFSNQPNQSRWACASIRRLTIPSSRIPTWKISSTQAAHSSYSQSSMPSLVVVGIVLVVGIGAYWWETRRSRRKAQEDQRKRKEEAYRHVPYERSYGSSGNNHDNLKHKHPTKESAEREIHRMKSVGKDGCERLNAYYNDGLDGWYVGNSHW